MRHLVIVALASLVLAMPALAKDEAETIFNSPGSEYGAVPSGPVWTHPSDAVVLYDNGPLVTHPGLCGGTSPNDSQLQTAIGLNVFGFGHAISAGIRVADDFEVPAGECWDVGAITFFAYQTGATSPTVNNVNFQIWAGGPPPGGVVIYGDQTTNVLAASQLSGTRRSIDTGACATNRLVMADICLAANLQLQGGQTYWVDWQSGGTLASGPWAPPISILGQATTGNAMQFITSWLPLVDSGTSAAVQGLPFIIEGFPCSTPVEQTTWGSIKNLY